MAGYWDVYIIALSLYEFMFIGFHLYPLPTCTQAVWAPGPTQGTAFGRPWASAGAETRPQSPPRLRLSAEAKDTRWSLGFREPVASGFRKCEDHHSLHLNGSQVEVCPVSIPTNYHMVEIEVGGHWGLLWPLSTSANTSQVLPMVSFIFFIQIWIYHDLSIDRPDPTSRGPWSPQRSRIACSVHGTIEMTWRHHDDIMTTLPVVQQSLRNRRSGWSRFNCRRRTYVFGLI